MVEEQLWLLRWQQLLLLALLLLLLLVDDASKHWAVEELVLVRLEGRQWPRVCGFRRPDARLNG